MVTTVVRLKMKKMLTYSLFSLYSQVNRIYTAKIIIKNNTPFCSSFVNFLVQRQKKNVSKTLFSNFLKFLDDS